MIPRFGKMRLDNPSCKSKLGRAFHGTRAELLGIRRCTFNIFSDGTQRFGAGWRDTQANHKTEFYLSFLTAVSDSATKTTAVRPLSFPLGVRCNTFEREVAEDKTHSQERTVVEPPRQHTHTRPYKRTLAGTQTLILRTHPRTYDTHTH